MKEEKINLIDNFLAREAQSQSKFQKKKLFNAILFSNFAYNSHQQKITDQSVQNEEIKCIDVNDQEFSDSNEGE